MPGAVVFDLGRGGRRPPAPGPAEGAEALRDALDAAEGRTVPTGVVGAGRGTVVGGLKGGVGSASTVLPDGTTVAAVVVANAAGSAVHPADRRVPRGAVLRAGRRRAAPARRPRRRGGAAGRPRRAAHDEHDDRRGRHRRRPRRRPRDEARRRRARRARPRRAPRPRDDRRRHVLRPGHRRATGDRPRRPAGGPRSGRRLRHPGRRPRPPRGRDGDHARGSLGRATPSCSNRHRAGDRGGPRSSPSTSRSGSRVGALVAQASLGDSLAGSVSVARPPAPGAGTLVAQASLGDSLAGSVSASLRALLPPRPLPASAPRSPERVRRARLPGSDTCCGGWRRTDDGVRPRGTAVDEAGPSARPV